MKRQPKDRRNPTKEITFTMMMTMKKRVEVTVMLGVRTEKIKTKLLLNNSNNKRVLKEEKLTKWKVRLIFWLLTKKVQGMKSPKTPIKPPRQTSIISLRNQRPRAMLRREDRVIESMFQILMPQIMRKRSLLLPG